MRRREPYTVNRSTAVIAVLLAYGACLLCVGVWATRRTHNGNDFLLGSRRMSLWFTSLSFTANATPPWLLFIVCGAAYVWGLAVVWAVAALLIGYLLNWFFVAPRLRALAVGHGNVTVLQSLCTAAGDRLQPLVVRSGVLILFFAVLLQAAAQLHFAGATLAAELDVDLSMVVSCLVIFLGVLAIAGGCWAASMSDVIAVGVLLTIGLMVPALVVSAGWSQIQSGVEAAGPHAMSWFAGKPGVVAAAFAIGLFGLGLAQVGQPQALNRFMSARDDRTIKIARWISCGVVILLLGEMLFCGWSARIIYAGMPQPEFALLTLGNRILPSWLAGAISTILLCAVLSGIMNQFLVAAATFSVDLKRPGAPGSIDLARSVTAIFALLATCLVAYEPASLLNQWLFAYNVMGASFGPLLLVRLTGKRVRPGSTLGAMWAGCILTVLFHLLPDSPGDILERVFPFVASLGIALTGGERRHNPDRADRAQDTVHDRVPI